MYNTDFFNDFRENEYILINEYLEILNQLNKIIKELRENYLEYEKIINNDNIITIEEYNQLVTIFDNLFEKSKSLKKIYEENLSFFNSIKVLLDNSEQMVEKFKYIRGVHIVVLPTL